MLIVYTKSFKCKLLHFLNKVTFYWIYCARLFYLSEIILIFVDCILDILEQHFVQQRLFLNVQQKKFQVEMWNCFYGLFTISLKFWQQKETIFIFGQFCISSKKQTNNYYVELKTVVFVHSLSPRPTISVSLHLLVLLFICVFTSVSADMSAKAISEQTGKEFLYKYICTSTPVQNKFRLANVTGETDFDRLVQEHPWLLTEVRTCNIPWRLFLYLADWTFGTRFV